MRTFSPLRYPGGKGKIYGAIKSLIEDNGLTDKTYVEPFAGGFAIGLKLLVEGVVKKVILNDFDFHVYAFWYTVLNDHKRLIKAIKSLNISISEWKNQKEIYNKCDRRSLFKIALSTLFLNRTNFSGIIKGGPIGGLSQQSKYKIDCRFNKDRICELIETIAKYKDSMEVYNLDALEFFEKIVYKRQKDFFIYLDPPYVKKGRDLYTNFYTEKDHKNLGKTIQEKLKCDWIMTYDNDPLVGKIYKNFCFIEKFSLRYTANKNSLGTELLVMPKKYLEKISSR